jgi:ankyrin repeat protein
MFGLQSEGLCLILVHQHIFYIDSVGLIRFLHFNRYGKAKIDSRPHKAQGTKGDRETGGSPLLYASTCGHFKVAKWLVSHGADPLRVRKDTGFTPFTIAVFGACAATEYTIDRYLRLLRWLLREVKVPVDQKMPKEHVTPLYYAASRGKTAVVRVLLSANANANFTAKFLSPGFGSALACAAQSGDVQLMTVLVEGGADVHHRAGLDGCTALHAATQGGQIRSMEWLALEGSADVNATTNQGDTALHMAVHRGRTGPVVWSAFFVMI